ncbi:MAG: patatin-like phospholipase family protein [Planctomycetes bacterium]|nr:patatin-like phospholipase family protein [Planctomycetota bacterium]
MRTGSSGRWELSGRARLPALAVVLALAAVVGCFGARPAPPAFVADKVWLNNGTHEDYHSDAADAVSGLALAMQGGAPDRPSDKPLNVLCVSGGGKYAAFTAGALCGWTATGTRPAFDVATGVSSGAPVALMAFLGPKYDRQLADLFLNLNRADLYVWRPVRGLVTGSGLMSSRPLARLLDRRLNEEALADLRAAHATGRRLFVATTNVRTHKLVVWDVGALASSDRPDAGELVRKVVLAACSIPGLVPPVEFDVTVDGVRYTELHADAGNLAQVFVRTSGPLPPGSAVWVLSAGKAYPNDSTGTPRVLESMVMAVSTTLYALFRADALRLYALCGVTRSRFRMLVLPKDFECRTNSMVFDHDESRRMYLVGYQMAAGDTWETQPPDTGS